MSDHLNEAHERMDKCVAALKRDFNTVRAGRATPALLDKVAVDYYGTPTPINQLANIQVPEPRLLVIQPWDKGIINDIERAIQKSDLGLSPSNDGVTIRLAIPQLTEARRIELTKVIKKMAEEARVAIRNVRRDVNDEIKKSEKQSLISEDESHRLQEKVQNITDKTVAEVDHLLGLKEKELLEV